MKDDGYKIRDQFGVYLISFARDYNGGKGLLPIDHLTAAYTLKR